MKPFFSKSKVLNRVVSSVAITSMLTVCATVLPYPTSAQTPGTSAPGSGGSGGYTPNPRAVSIYNLGLTAFRQNSLESAITFFLRACDLDPNLADAQYNLGAIYLSQKRYPEACRRFEEVLRIKPSDPDAHYHLGVAYMELGRYNDAKQQLTSIAPNNPRFGDAQKKLAQLDRQQSTGTAPPQQPVSNAPANQYPYTGSQIAGSGNTGYTTQPQYAPNQNQAQGGDGPAAYTGQPATPATQTTNETQAVPQQNTAQPVSTEQPVSTLPGTKAGLPAPKPVPIMPNVSLRVIANGFSAPSGLAFDKTGNLYVANYMTNSIERIALDGTRSTFASGANLRGPIGLVMDDNNNLYVANYNGGSVVRINAAGISTVIANGFRNPYYLTLDRENNLYVSQQEDNSVVRITLPKAAPRLQ